MNNVRCWNVRPDILTGRHLDRIETTHPGCQSDPEGAETREETAGQDKTTAAE
jgi:hypothetical protein